MKDYLHESKRLIGRFGKREWTKDEDCVAFISYELMKADGRFDPNFGTKRVTYRIACGRWALVTWANKLKKKYSTPSGQKIHNIGFNYAPIGKERSIKNYSPVLSELIEAEELENKQKFVKKLINHDLITNRLRTYLNGYFVEGKTCAKIAGECGVSTQAVSEGIRRAVATLKEVTHGS